MDNDIRRRMQDRIDESRKLLAELSPGADRQHAKPARDLTVQEDGVARLLAEGKQIKEIAGALGMGESGVRYHLARIATLLPPDELSDRDRVLVWAYWEYRPGKAA